MFAVYIFASFIGACLLVGMVIILGILEAKTGAVSSMLNAIGGGK